MSKSYAGVEDILCDDTFLSWYFKTDVRAMRQWERWMAGNPGSRPRIQQAIEFLQSLHIHEEESPGSQLTYAEKRLLEKIKRAQTPVRTSLRSIGRTFSFKGKWWIAAACI